MYVRMYMYVCVWIMCMWRGVGRSHMYLDLPSQHTLIGLLYYSSSCSTSSLIHVLYILLAVCLTLLLYVLLAVCLTLLLYVLLAGCLTLLLYVLLAGCLTLLLYVLLAGCLTLLELQENWKTCPHNNSRRQWYILLYYYCIVSVCVWVWV